MVRFNVVLALIFLILFTVFAFVNNQIVEINYLFGDMKLSAVLVILGSAVLGALVVFILGLVKNIQDKMKLRTLNHKVKDLQDRLQVIEKERDDLLMRTGRLQEANSAAKQVDPVDKKEN